MFDLLSPFHIPEPNKSTKFYKSSSIYILFEEFSVGIQNLEEKSMLVINDRGNISLFREFTLQ